MLIVHAMVVASCSDMWSSLAHSHASEIFKSGLTDEPTSGRHVHARMFEKVTVEYFFLEASR